jgi:hypothetical protein
MARKTLDVAELLDWTNRLLAMPESDVITPQHKQGAIHALDYVLHATGNYHGFRYLDTYDETDPEFAHNGRKGVRREYFRSAVLLRQPKG